MDYPLIWFVLWATLWTMYFALDGANLGAAFAGLSVSSGPEERRAVFSSFGPFWDGHEVWLITAGAATFAAFPPAYAALFSWLYPAVLLLLLSLIARGAAVEFRGKNSDRRWQKFWEYTAAGSSLSAALLLGIAFGNIFLGLDITEYGYAGNFLSLLNPYAVLTGLLFCAFFLLHGLLWLSHKTGGAVAAKALTLAAKVWYPAAVLLALFLLFSAKDTALSAGAQSRPLPALMITAAAGALFSVRTMIRRKRPSAAAKACFAAIFLFSASCFACLYPNLLPSRIDPALSFTIRNAASGEYTLRVMTFAAAVLLPVVIACQIWAHRLFRKPLSREELESGGIY